MKIGIMTMHRVQNMGSVLQAYALQHKLAQLGYEAELIDYIFPAPRKTKFSIYAFVGSLLNAVQGFPKQKTEKKLEFFRKQYLHCSPTSYTRERLMSDPPKYDLYCTGSDQVWNPLHVGDDTSFMFDFVANDKPRIAFASSFASKRIEEPFYSLYAEQLKKYSSIAVREKTGSDIVKDMTGKEAPVVCDPTLLLSAEEWETVGRKSDVHIKGGYILVYLLRYMFNPRPEFYTIVESVRKTTGLPVYQFNPFTPDMVQPHVRNLKGMGPLDFVNLCKNASFIVTDSFHGTAFATIFNKPVIGVVKDNKSGDGRIATLRTNVGGDKSVVCYNQPFYMKEDEIGLYRCDISKVESMRDNSIKVLINMIQKI